MNPDPIAPSPSFSARLTGLRSKLSGLQKNVSALEEHLDGVLCDLDGLAGLPDLPPHLPPPSISDFALAERHRLLRQQASAGARSVKITPHANGAAHIQIDGRREVALPPAVAALFQILKDDFGTRTDQMVGWKTIAEIKQALVKRNVGSFTDRAVIELVYRLRRKFAACGENQFLIQSRRNLGYRLALWRGGDL